jgi:hypothetical protein
MSGIVFKNFRTGFESQYGGYVWADADNLEKAKAELLEVMFNEIREIAKKDAFWIVKKVDANDPIGLIGCPTAYREKPYTVGWKVHFPQMEPEKDYKERMKEEYWQTKRRYQKLHDMCIKYEAGTLDFTPTCSLDLLKEQKGAMGNYLRCLEVRAEIEGVKL